MEGPCGWGGEACALGRVVGPCVAVLSILPVLSRRAARLGSCQGCTSSVLTQRILWGLCLGVMGSSVPERHLSGRAVVCVAHPLESWTLAQGPGQLTGDTSLKPLCSVSLTRCSHASCPACCFVKKKGLQESLREVWSLTCEGNCTSTNAVNIQKCGCQTAELVMCCKFTFC